MASASISDALRKSSSLQLQGSIPSLTSSIRGQQLLIPSLDRVFKYWPRRTNDGYEDLKPVIMEDFRRMMPNPKKLAKLAMDDYALCGSGMYMNADFTALRVMTLLTTWLFFFDDKVDNKEGDMFNDATGFTGLAKQAMDYAAYTMGLTRPGEYKEPEEGLDDFVALFRDVGEGLMWLEEGVRLPPCSELPVEELVPLWTEIRDLMIFVNDLYSFRNEMYSENGASLVTLCLEKGSNLEEAVQEIYQEIISAKSRFDRHAGEIRKRFPADKHAELDTYFDSLKALVTGYHTWW